MFECSIRKNRVPSNLVSTIFRMRHSSKAVVFEGRFMEYADVVGTIPSSRRVVLLLLLLAGLPDVCNAVSGVSAV